MEHPRNAPALPAVERLYFPGPHRNALESHLPPPRTSTPRTSTRPHVHVTLTYAASLDSRIALAPGQPTALSGAASKAMTHFLRTRHDAILVGAGTAIADDPGLNSRLADAVDAGDLSLQPRPIVLDRRGDWQVCRESRVVRTASAARGKAPWIFVGADAVHAVPAQQRAAVEGCGGQYLVGESWQQVLDSLAERGIQSLMVEGGARVINDLLTDHADTIDAFILTLAPTFLGAGGVEVVPRRKDQHSPAVQFHDVKWVPLESDVVMCARVAA